MTTLWTRRSARAVARATTAGLIGVVGCNTPGTADRSATSAAPGSTTSTTATATRSRTAGFSVTPAQRARLHVVTVQPTSYQPVVQATGTVAFNGDRSTPVLSEVSGPALRILVDPGAAVRQGDPLATVSSPDFATAVAGFRKAQSAYGNLSRIAALDAQLFKNDALARRELEQAQTDAAAAAADREAAIQQMRALGVGATQIADITNNRASAPLVATIRAPITGTVVERLIAPGQLLTAGTTQAFTVADLSTMWVMASVFVDDLRNVAVGETVDVITDAAPTPIPGRVAYIAALVDSSSNAVNVRVLVPNRGLVLRRGMFVRVAIHSARQQKDILVPVSAVLRDEQNLPFVFVTTPDGSFVRRQVTLGQQVGDQYAIRTGLTAGEQVVAEGALFVQFAETQ